jgi:hypothetical protein
MVTTVVNVIFLVSWLNAVWLILVASNRMSFYYYIISCGLGNTCVHLFVHSRIRTYVHD